MPWQRIDNKEVSPQTPLQETNTQNYSYRNRQADKLMDSVNDLVDDTAFHPFFFKRLYAIGPTRFLGLADQARKRGIDKGRYFVTLLKREPIQ